MYKVTKIITILSLAVSLSFTGCGAAEKEEKSFIPDPLVIHAEYNEPKSVEVAVEPEPVSVPAVSSRPIITDEDVDLLALLTMAEAEGESEYGKRLVIDTVLNRVDSEYFPDTIYDVVYQKSQFSGMYGNRITKCYVKDDIRKLVMEELDSRTNYDVMFFHAGKYGKYGTPMFREGNHYFSSY